MPRRGTNDADRRRETLRDNIWPGSDEWIWDINDPATIGFATVPRLLPLVCHLLKHLAENKAGDPSSVYTELWCRDYGQGIITISDEQDCAFASGYTGNRAVRTWRERMFALVELKFILAERDGNREYGQVLLLNPIEVCAQLRAEGRVPSEWWTAFVRRAGDIGAKIPKKSNLPGSKSRVAATG